MKLGISYNLFDGEELLTSSILSVRDSCDYINVIYQTISNYGDKCHDGMEDLLIDLKRQNLIDQLFLFQPKKFGGGKNELIKRNIGLKLANKAKCTHFLGMDCDEFYKKDEFEKAKTFIKQNNIDISSCKHIGYIQKPIYQFVSPSFYYVPFISRIKMFSKFDTKNYFPVLTDPTRRLKGDGKFKYFEQEELLMHHMSLVRKDLKKKFINSSAKEIYIKSGIIEQINSYKYPEDWVDPTVHFVDPAKNNAFKVKQVENIFNINI